MPKRRKSRLRKPVRVSYKIVLGCFAGIFIFVSLWFVQRHWDSVSYSIEEFVVRTLGATVESIVVESMVESELHTTQAELMESLGLKKGDSLVGFDAGVARESLEQLPWVEVASVERRLPSTVKVEIFEYRPLARLEDDDGMWLIDKRGHKIVLADDSFNHLPVVSGSGSAEMAAELFSLLERAGKYSQPIVSVAFIGERRWDVHFASGVTVQLPEKNPHRGLLILRKLDRSRNILDVNGGMVDLRLEDRITIRLPDGEVMKERAHRE